MGLLDDVFDGDANDASDTSSQIVLTQGSPHSKDKTYTNNLETRVTSVTHVTPEIPPFTPRQTIERLLSQGPQPYSEVLSAVGGDEDALRETIRGWDELAAFDDSGVWTWELAKTGRTA